MDDIPNKIIELLKTKRPRYITRQYIQKLYGEEFYDNIMTSTSFLDKDHTISERLFCFYYNINNHIKCLHCQNDINKFEKFYSSKEEYLERFCSHKCIRSYMYDMTSPIIPNSSLNKNDILFKIQHGNFNQLRFKPHFMNGVKTILHDDNIPYERMTALEALYFLKNNHKNYPTCYCGNFLPYFNKGIYRKYCSNKCKANSEQQKTLKKQTCLQKYGTENVFANDQIRQRIQQTNIEKYGVSHYCKTEEYKQRLQTGDIKRQIADPYKIRKHIFDKMYDKIQTFRDKLQIIPLFTRDEYTGSGYHKQYKWKCLVCETEFEHWYYEINKLKCPKCTTHSNIEMTIIDYVAKLPLTFQVNTRTIISPYELDVYFPEKHLGIEINGLYWHSESTGKPRKSHVQKTELCEKNNIRLIQLFADEIMYQLPIVKCRLKHILGLIKRKIYARKCEVKPISVLLKNKFLNKYHIQGKDNSTINLGLHYKNRLVAVMTFSKLRKVLALEHKEGSYELSRFAAINHFVIVGGADKLLKYFERNYQPKTLTTYADRRWSQGDVYYKLGFQLDHISAPSYWYTKDYYHRIYRFNFRKNILKTKLAKFDPNLSEWENMKANGYDRIWDCGNMVFTKKYIATA